MSSRFAKVKEALSLKSLTGRVKFPGRSLIFFDLGASDRSSMARDVGDGTGSDVLMTPVRWLQRQIVEAPIVAKDGAGEPIDPSALIDLLKTPNPHYAWEVLIAGTVLSLSLDGNAYWIVALSDDRLPAEIWYAPHTNIEPRWPDDNRANEFVTYYQYKVHGDTQKIAPMGADPKDVDAGVEANLVMIHFREGVDLGNLRKGLSPLKGLLREIWTDNEAARFTATLLRNNGIPGVIVSPASESATLTPEEGEQAREKLQMEYTASGRGKPLVMLGPTKVEQFGFSPKELDLSPLRDVSEERVTAALGVVAAVVGFGSGLQQTKVGATMKELRQLSWTNGVIPLQRIVAGEVTRTLAPVFDEGSSVEFDNSDVEALRENQDIKAARVERLVRAGVLTRAEGRTDLGMEVHPGDEVYLMSLATIEVPQGEVRVVPPTNGAGTEKERTRVRDILYKVHQGHTHGPEDAIIQAAPKVPATAATARAARRLDIIRRSAGRAMEVPLEEVFANLGRSAATAARAVLAEDELTMAGDPDQDIKVLPYRPQLPGFTPGKYIKGELSGADQVLVEQILALTDTAAAQVTLQTTLEEGYLVVANDVSGAVGQALGVAFELDDVATRNVLRAGGLRAGLVDLDQQTREAIFESLAAGRERGLTADNLARFIADDVEGGTWGSAAVRARVIARTEGANAANVSTLEAARSMPETEHVQIFDNRTGTNDELCVAADTRVVTIDEAEAMGLAHPNCTRSFVPVNSLLMEEMGL